jgi:hypothetical protein
LRRAPGSWERFRLTGPTRPTFSDPSRANAPEGFLFFPPRAARNRRCPALPGRETRIPAWLAKQSAGPAGGNGATRLRRGPPMAGRAHHGPLWRRAIFESAATYSFCNFCEMPVVKSSVTPRFRMSKVRILPGSQACRPRSSEAEHRSPKGQYSLDRSPAVISLMSVRVVKMAVLRLGNDDRKVTSAFTCSPGALCWW